MLDSIIQHVELFHGFADPTEARVYAVITLAEKFWDKSKPFKLTGLLTGPECEFAQTLPARIPFVHCGSDETLLAEAFVPDPCFWSPDLPFLYRAELQLHGGQAVAGEQNGIIGIRRLGIRDRKLYFEGKRFVLRGIGSHFDLEALSDTEMAYLRQTWTATIVKWPSTALCKLASRYGMLIIADLRINGNHASFSAVAQTARLVAQWPAVVMAIVDAGALPGLEPRGAIRNLLIAQYISAADPLPLDLQAQIIFAEVGELGRFANRFENSNRPIIAVRPLPHTTKIESARAACDVLQADLAPYGDFAGYIV
jgi:hypothetical protein